MIKLDAEPGTPEAQKQITAVVVILICAWTASNAMIQFGAVSEEQLLPFLLGNPDGSLPVQLLVYSFIAPGRGLVGFLFTVLFPALWMAGLVNIVKGEFNLPSFIRLYSIGTIVVGALLWASGILSHWSHDIAGPWVPIGTILGASVACDPHRRVFIWGERAADFLRSSRLGIVLPVLAAVYHYWELRHLLAIGGGALEDERDFLYGLVLVAAYTLPYLWVVVSLFRVRVLVVAGVWLAMSGAFCLMHWVLSRYLVFDWSWVAIAAIALAAGAAYAKAERYCRQRLAG